MKATRYMKFWEVLPLVITKGAAVAQLQNSKHVPCYHAHASVALRRKLDVYANHGPVEFVTTAAKLVDMIIASKNTEDLHVEYENTSNPTVPDFLMARRPSHQKHLAPRLFALRASPGTIVDETHLPHPRRYEQIRKTGSHAMRMRSLVIVEPAAY
ncbi:hypothetical protein QBC32DRAFT_364736 [Pseudoneurospora amorphoporcata]|uniref:Uncharacterized protein n=1 Tax=Pseudoneurospora amorphoporcata TaxID=241081 RepID=A0AAN6NPW0_9PEZI|nr:hypothetical protein QBC32DRAFT_364736 [Pseudoneurospora amorphoporcata]